MGAEQKTDRGEMVVKAGWAFIWTNFGLAGLNALIGWLSGSVAVVSDALHSLVDGVSGVLIIVSEKLASHKKLSERRQQIERLATVSVALIIIAAGLHLIAEAIERIATPEAPDYSPVVILLLVVGIVAKYALASYLKKTGEKIKSPVVRASGVETMNDGLISVAILLSALVYLIFRVDIEAYVSLAVALIVIKSGLEFIFPHLSHHHHHHLEADPDHDHCNRQ